MIIGNLLCGVYWLLALLIAKNVLLMGPIAQLEIG